MTEREISVYIHYPFCLKKCNYCTFYSERFSPPLSKSFFQALKHEFLSLIDSGLMRGPGLLRSLYIGGGTPSLADVNSLYEILSLITKRFPVHEKVELTIEANPFPLTREKLILLHELGFNRISLGIQTLSTFGLRLLGRIHSPKDALRAIDISLEVGYKNVNADLIIGYPYQTIESLRRTLRELLKRPLSHVSAYTLEVKEGSKLWRWGFRERPARYSKLFSFLRYQLINRGFKRYEVSNFALPGKESVHNLRYWEYGDWIGLGPSSMGKITLSNGTIRYRRISDIRDYLEAFSAPTSFLSALSEMYELDEYEELEERLMMGLRMSKGINLSSVSAKMLPLVMYSAAPLLREGMLLIRGNRLAIPEEMLDIAHVIIGDLLEKMEVMRGAGRGEAQKRRSKTGQ